MSTFFDDNGEQVYIFLRNRIFFYLLFCSLCGCLCQRCIYNTSGLNYRFIVTNQPIQCRIILINLELHQKMRGISGQLVIFTLAYSMKYICRRVLTICKCIQNLMAKLVLSLQVTVPWDALLFIQQTDRQCCTHVISFVDTWLTWIMKGNIRIFLFLVPTCVNLSLLLFHIPGLVENVKIESFVQIKKWKLFVIVKS